MLCPVCNNESKIFMKGIYDCEKTLVRECINCKLHFLDPKMSLEEETTYYSDYYKNQESRQKQKYTLHNIQQNSLNHYNEYYKEYNDLIKDAKSILEIGSGAGGFLKFIKSNTKNNTKISSIEKSKSNLDFLKKEFSDVNFYDSFNEIKNEKFDVIVAFGVFEHIRDLDKFLYEISLLSSKNTKITFKIPNNNDILISFFQLEEYKKFMYMKQHYYVFSKESLSYIAKNAKLEIDKIKYIQVWGIDNHLSWLKDKKAQDFYKFTEIFNEKLSHEYKKNLIEQEMSDIIMVTFRNKK